MNVPEYRGASSSAPVLMVGVALVRRIIEKHRRLTIAIGLFTTESQGKTAAVNKKGITKYLRTCVRFRVRQQRSISTPKKLAPIQAERNGSAELNPVALKENLRSAKR